MDTLKVTPDAQGFTVDEGNTNIAIQLAGGDPRVRADQLGAVKTVSCQWTLTPQGFTYMMAFYRTSTGNGSLPFLISLAGIESANFATYTARFVPGTFKPLASQQGHAYVLGAQLWVTPINDTTNDAAIIAAGPGL